MGYGNVTVASIPARIVIISVLVYGLITLSSLIDKLAAALSGRGAHQWLFMCVRLHAVRPHAVSTRSQPCLSTAQGQRL